jgi:hypothetical protein
MLKAIASAIVLLLSMAGGARAQEHDHAKMLRDQAEAAAGWHVAQDGVAFLMFNHQSGRRGGDELVAPNWWMLMGSRKGGRGTMTLTGMLSLDPATVGADGYRELFQTGEVYHGEPLIDRQHPHDLFMELSASWRVALPAATSLTFSGGPAGAPAIGPVAFMHRASAFDNPMAPLTHHLFDSTHISFGVASAALERGPWTLEGSVFNGREPDENRWNFDFARMDSAAGRLSFKPNPQWALQISTAHLVHPERFEPGDAQRTTASASWTRTNGQTIDAITAGFGINSGPETEFVRGGAFAEGARHIGGHTLYGRIEILKIDPHIAAVNAAAFTIGGVRDILSRNGFESGVGAAITVTTMPALLDPFYGAHPVGFQVFFRLRGAEHMINMQ